MTEEQMLDLFRSIIKTRREDFGAEYYKKILEDPRKIHGLMANSLIDGLAASGCVEYSVWRYLTDICLQDQRWTDRHCIGSDNILAPVMGYMWPEDAHKFNYKLVDDHFEKLENDNLFKLTIENGHGTLSIEDCSHEISGWHVLSLWEDLLSQGITE